MAEASNSPAVYPHERELIVKTPVKTRVVNTRTPGHTTVPGDLLALHLARAARIAIIRTGRGGRRATKD